MSNVRRWYIYLVCAIGLQGVVWAIIALLRNLFLFDLDPTAVAFQIAVILIGLPIFLAHWLWAQRLAKRSKEERGSSLRRFYLYGMMAGFLAPWITNAYDLVGTILRAPGTADRHQSLRSMSTSSAIFFHFIPLVILAVFWFYHQRVQKEDARAISKAGPTATIRRIYVLGFSAAGLTAVTLAVIHLIRWVMIQFGDPISNRNALYVALSDEITRLLIGVPLWLIFWIWAGRLFDSGEPEERSSTLRKFYLYSAVFIGAISVVSYSTAILAGLFRRLLSLDPSGDIRLPLPIIIGAGVLWAYHAFVLRADVGEDEGLEQAWVRRLYLYLVAAIGLAALLIGLGGDISVIIRSFATSLGTALREQLAWYTAGIIAGLPLWILPWRIAQNEAIREDAIGTDQRQSVVRKIYLYFFLFFATLTVLSSAVFIVYRILSMVLGEDPPTLIELGHAISFTFLAVLVWLYHGYLLRGDRQLSQKEKREQTKALRVSVLDVGDAGFQETLIQTLKESIPGLQLNRIPATALQTTPSETRAPALPDQLAAADLIVGSWEMVMAGPAGGNGSPALAEAIQSSPARKLLIPIPRSGWDWAGVESSDSKALVEHTTQAVTQILKGDPVSLRRPLGCGAIAAIVVGVFLLLNLVIAALSWFFF